MATPTAKYAGELRGPIWRVTITLDGQDAGSYEQRAENAHWAIFFTTYKHGDTWAQARAVTLAVEWQEEAAD